MQSVKPTAADAFDEAIRQANDLASTAPSLDAFFRWLVERITALGEVLHIGVWAINADGVVDEVHAGGSDDSPLPKEQRLALVLETLTSRRMLTRRTVGRERPVVAMVSPTFLGDAPALAIEAISETGPRPDTLRELLAAFAPAVSECVRRFAPSNEARKADDEVLGVALRLHQAGAAIEVAHVAANEARRLFGCDRAAVVSLPKRGAGVTAFSGVDRVARQSDAASGVRRIAEIVRVSGQGGAYSTASGGGETPLDEALLDHAYRTGATRIEAHPLKFSAAPDGASIAPNGVLVTESFEGVEPTPAAASPLLEHIALALRNAMRRDRASRWLPLGIASPAGEESEAPSLRRKALGTLLAFAIAGGVAMTPAPHRIHVEGSIVPERRSLLFAPSDAEVAEVHVQGGQLVTKGQPLLRLQSVRLESQRASLQSEEERQGRLLAALWSEADADSRDASSTARVRGQIAQIEVEIDGLRERRRLVEAELERLTIDAPHDGRLATFDADRLLRDRPVRRGDALLEVMDFQGDWRLRLECPSSQLSHVTRAMNDGPTPVTFSLSTRPGEVYAATARRLANRASVGQGGESFVALQADIASGAFPPETEAIAGGGVRARINCGARPLAYALFSRAIDAASAWAW